MRETVLLPGPRAYRDLMSDVERRAIDDRLALIERGIAADVVTRLDDPDAPLVHIFDDGTWRIVYMLPDQAAVAVLGIRHALDLPE